LILIYSLYRKKCVASGSRDLHAVLKPRGEKLNIQRREQNGHGTQTLSHRSPDDLNHNTAGRDDLAEVSCTAGGSAREPRTRTRFVEDGVCWPMAAGSIGGRRRGLTTTDDSGEGLAAEDSLLFWDSLLVLATVGESTSTCCFYPTFTGSIATRSLGC
jgi:hypothetical protein